MVLRKHTAVSAASHRSDEPSTNTEVCHEYLQYDRLLGRLSWVLQELVGLVGLVWVGWYHSGNFPILSSSLKTLGVYRKEVHRQKKIRASYEKNIQQTSHRFV